MEYIGPSEEKVSGNSKFISLYADICRESELKKRKWIKSLMNSDVKAAHPDDGWVDREKNEVQFAYPQFNSGIVVGDIVALGWPDKYRLVEIIGIRTGLFNIFLYQFKESNKPLNTNPDKHRAG